MSAQPRFKMTCPHCGQVGSTSKVVPVGAKIRCPGCRQIYRYQDEAPTLEPASTSPRVPEVQAETHSGAPTDSMMPEEPAAVFAALNTAPVAAPIQQHIQVNAVDLQKGNALGIASLVLGIIAALVCWIPFIGLTAIPVGLVGLLLGTIALTLVVVARSQGLAVAAVGCGLSLVAMVSSVVITGAAPQRIADAINGSAKPEPVAQAVPEQVEPQGAAPEVAAAAAQPEASPTPAPTLERPPEPTMVFYPDSARLAHMEVRITRLVRGKVRLRGLNLFADGDGHDKSQDECLSIYIEVKNLDDGKKVDYLGFKENLFDYGTARLADDLGNKYRQVDFGFTRELEDRTDTDTIYPGKSISDHLVFELPVGKASGLILDLPGKGVGIDEGVFRFGILKSDIEGSVAAE